MISSGGASNAGSPRTPRPCDQLDRLGYLLEAVVGGERFYPRPERSSGVLALW